MIAVLGKRVYESLQELVDPAHTAILVVDVQNDYCHPNGHDARRNRLVQNREALLARHAHLIGHGRDHGVLIVYVKNTLLPHRLSDSPARLRSQLRFWQASDPSALPTSVIEGSWGHEIVDEIKPHDGDLVVKKHRSSAFFGTSLDMLLGSNGIETVIVTGLATEACVESTAKDAAFLDYYVVVPEDCVSSWNLELHEAALTIMRTQFDCVACDDVVRVWARATMPAALPS